jgi:hypothetical protein
MGKWIDFDLVDLPAKNKTKIWNIRTKDSHDLIGVVRWHCPWRKYCLFGITEVVYEQDCLRDIAEFIEQKTKEHHQKIKESK